jgi:hypothetical protein
MKNQKLCHQCGQKYIGGATARYCSESCKQRAKRKRAHAQTTPHIEPTITDETTCNLMTESIVAASALREAAESCGFKLRPLCIELSEPVLDAARRNGLLK